MTSKLNGQSFGLIAFVIFAITGLTWSALAGSGKTTQAENQSARTGATEPSGEELWTMNCQRCHNIRPPTMYSNAQWDVIVHHMRVRANITGADQRAIVEFLKSSSH
jgi:hypothetical protein